MTINMLNLPSFKILDMKESEYDYRFLVETTLPSPSIAQNVVQLLIYISMVKRNNYYLICRCMLNELASSLKM